MLWLWDIKECNVEAEKQHQSGSTTVIVMRWIHKLLKWLMKYHLTSQSTVPKKIITDSGREFQDRKLKMFCNKNGIELSHFAPRTPTTQGLTERSNLSWKQDLWSLIVSTAGKSIKKWCQYTREALYTRKISYHWAIKLSPYEGVDIIKPCRKKLTQKRKLIRRRRRRRKQCRRNQPKTFTTIKRRATKKMTKHNRKPNKILQLSPVQSN